MITEFKVKDETSGFGGSESLCTLKLIFFFNFLKKFLNVKIREILYEIKK